MMANPKPNSTNFFNQTPVVKTKIIAIAIVITLLFLVFFFLIGWNAASPAGCDGTFACLTANEWGDLLAGISAPIAFVWLVVAVFIQSYELKEQRNELALTRQEFELNRRVMEGQAASLHSQTEALLQDRATHEFLERIRLLRFWIETNFSDVRDVYDGYSSTGEPILMRKDVGHLTANKPSEPLVYFSALLTAIGTSLAKGVIDDCAENRWLNYSNPIDISTLGMKLKQIINMRDRVGPSAAAVLVDADADYVLENFPEISEQQISEALLRSAADF